MEIRGLIKQNFVKLIKNKQTSFNISLFVCLMSFGKLLSILFVFFVFLSPYTALYARNIPQRVVSLSPAITEEIYLLGEQDKLIGCTTYCRRPKEVRQKTKIATITEVNIERIILLKPDLIFVTPLTNMQAVTRLKQLGIKVMMCPQAATFEEICDQFFMLGDLFNKKTKADRIIRKAQHKILSIQNKLVNFKKIKVFIQIGTNPLFTVPKESFINDYIKRAGGINIAADAPRGIYSREKVFVLNPDVIFITAMGIMADQEKKIWEKYETLTAVKNNRIYILDEYDMCSPTPLTFVRGLEKMVLLLYPQLSKNKYEK